MRDLRQLRRAFDASPDYCTESTHQPQQALSHGLLKAYSKTLMSAYGPQQVQSTLEAEATAYLPIWQPHKFVPKRQEEAIRAWLESLAGAVGVLRPGARVWARLVLRPDRLVFKTADDIVINLGFEDANGAPYELCTLVVSDLVEATGKQPPAELWEISVVEPPKKPRPSERFFVTGTAFLTSAHARLQAAAQWPGLAALMERASTSAE